jgi:hypothetical protein
LGGGAGRTGRGLEGPGGRGPAREGGAGRAEARPKRRRARCVCTPLWCSAGHIQSEVQTHCAHCACACRRTHYLAQNTQHDACTHTITNTRTHAHARALTHAHTYTRAHTHTTHTQTHTHTHTYTHTTHTHTHTHTNGHPPLPPQMLVDLGPAVYESDFERPFLAVAADFYAKEAQAFVASCDCPQYLRKVRRACGLAWLLRVRAYVSTAKTAAPACAHPASAPRPARLPSEPPCPPPAPGPRLRRAPPGRAAAGRGGGPREALPRRVDGGQDHARGGERAGPGAGGGGGHLDSKLLGANEGGGR